MKKTLIFYLYVNDYVYDNKNYIIHKECLKYYKHIFDEMIFYVGVDDITNNFFINDAVMWVNEVCKGSAYNIKIRQSTPLCETQFFKEEIIDNRNNYKDNLIFIAHSKNVSRLNKDLSLMSQEGMNGSDVIPDSIIKWVISAYFYGLNFENEIQEKLLGCPLPSELFFGPLLTVPRNKLYDSKFSNNKGNCYYQGTFYWINMNKLINLLKKYPDILPEISDRFYFEDLPGMLASSGVYGGGCSSHNYISITDDFNLYKMGNDEWIYLINILGDSNDFWYFYNNVMNNVLKNN